MVNKFVIVGKVQVISKDNPDYPGFYINPLGEDKLIPVSLRRDEEYLDNTHSIIINNATWERVIAVEDRNLNYLKKKYYNVKFLIYFFYYSFYSFFFYFF